MNGQVKQRNIVCFWGEDEQSFLYCKQVASKLKDYDVEVVSGRFELWDDFESKSALIVFGEGQYSEVSKGISDQFKSDPEGDFSKLSISLVEIGDGAEADVVNEVCEYALNRLDLQERSGEIHGEVSLR